MGLGKPSPTDLLPRVPDETLDQLGKDLGHLAAQYDLRPELVLLLAFSIHAVHGQPVRISVIGAYDMHAMDGQPRLFPDNFLSLHHCVAVRSDD